MTANEREERELSGEIIDQREAAVLMLSEADFWELELNFFDRLLRLRALSTGSQYGDRIAENLQRTLFDLQADLTRLKNELREHEQLLADMTTNGPTNAEQQYSEQHENCIVHSGQFNKRFKAYKKDLFDFAERYGETGD